MTKRMFWTLFKSAWEASFTSKSIEKAFEKTGIWPFYPEKTLKSLKKPSSPPTTPSTQCYNKGEKAQATQ
jgi:hypothetical protein